MAFIQYYDIFPNTEVPLDNFDANIICIGVKWERNAPKKEGHERGKLFALCTMDSVRGLVLVLLIHCSKVFTRQCRTKSI